METIKLRISKESINKFNQSAGIIYTHTQNELNKIMRDNSKTIIQDMDGNKFIQVNKATAKRFFDSGKLIYLQPNKTRFNSFAMPPMPTSRHAGEFEKVINQFLFYCCNSEAGRYPHYFIKYDDYLNN